MGAVFVVLASSLPPSPRPRPLPLSPLKRINGGFGWGRLAWSARGVVKLHCLTVASLQAFARVTPKGLPSVAMSLLIADDERPRGC